MSKTMINYDLIHSRLRSTRENLGLGIVEVGEDTGIAPQYLGQLELNRTPGVWSHILRLAAHYETTTDYLLGAAWCLNSLRNPNSAHTNEAMRAMEILDSYPPAVRMALLTGLESQAKVFARLVDQATENIQLRLSLADFATHLTPEQIRVSDATVAERIAQLLTR